MKIRPCSSRREITFELRSLSFDDIEYQNPFKRAKEPPLGALPTRNFSTVVRREINEIVSDVRFRAALETLAIEIRSHVSLFRSLRN